MNTSLPRLSQSPSLLISGSPALSLAFAAENIRKKTLACASRSRKAILSLQN